MSWIKYLIFVSTSFIAIPAFADSRPLTEEQTMQIVKKAAKDEGYTLAGSDVWFKYTGRPSGDYLTPDYVEVSMNIGAHPLHAYAIRTDTGDIIDWVECELFRYPDLMQFRRQRLKITGIKPPNVDQLEWEAGCNFRILSAPQPLRKPIIQEPCNAC